MNSLKNGRFAGLVVTDENIQALIQLKRKQTLKTFEVTNFNF
jgi:hypothetical protein